MESLSAGLHQALLCAVCPASFCYPTGGTITCTLVVTNTGNATLLAVSGTGVNGSTVACASSIIPLAQGNSTSCIVTRAVSQGDFDAWDSLAQAVDICAHITSVTGPNSDVPSLTATTGTLVALQSQQSVTVVGSVTPQTVHTEGRCQVARPKGWLGCWDRP